MIKQRTSISAILSTLALYTSCGHSPDSNPTPTATVSPSVSPTASTTSGGTQSTTGSATTTGATGATATAGPTGATGTSPDTGATSATGQSSGGGDTASTAPSTSTTNATTSTATTGTTGPSGSTDTSTTTVADASSTTTDTAPPVPEPTLVTSGEGAYWQEGTVTESSGAATVTVNDGSALTEWHGFGGTFNEKGWVALQALSPEDRERAIRLLFDKSQGAGFTYGRIPVGASDYGTSRYTLNDIPSGQTDPNMEQFSIERDQMALIPYIKAALDVKPDIKFWASPWTPPPWMKSNGAYDRGNMNDSALPAMALYLARFVEEYEKEGIIIRAIHPQNEAGYAQDYPSCNWTNQQMVTFIGQELGPLFEERGIEAEIWVGTLSNPTVDNSIGQAVMADATAMSYVKGYGLQWGMDANTGTYVGKGLPVMQTEHKCGNQPWDENQNQTENELAPNDHAYALQSWGFLKNWISKGVNSYSAWNMVLDTSGRSLDDVRIWHQNALLAVDTQAKTLILTPTYHVFRHLAQYVDPGASRVGTQGGDALAFKNPDGSVVTILHNSGAQASATTLSAAGQTVEFSIPARGWATVNLQP